MKTKGVKFASQKSKTSSAARFCVNQQTIAVPARLTTAARITLDPRDQRKDSLKSATVGCTSDIELVIAAKKRRIKNKNPNN